MAERTQMNVNEERPVACDSCDWKGRAGESEYIADLAERLDPGTGTVPAGQCPDCGALCYVTDLETPEPKRPKLTKSVQRGLQNIWAFCDANRFEDSELFPKGEKRLARDTEAALAYIDARRAS